MYNFYGGHSYGNEWKLFGMRSSYNSSDAKRSLDIFSNTEGFHLMEKVIAKFGVLTCKTPLLETDDIYLTRKKKHSSW